MNRFKLLLKDEETMGIVPLKDRLAAEAAASRAAA